LADWPRAVGALADHLGVGRFAVRSHSLGSAYALGCRPALGDRLAVIVIASGMGPLRPGERFRSGNRADDLYWRLARAVHGGRDSERGQLSQLEPRPGRAPRPQQEPESRAGDATAALAPDMASTRHGR
jgi:hypothetical protein